MIFLQLNLVAKKVVFKEGGHVILKMATKLDDSRFFWTKNYGNGFFWSKIDIYQIFWSKIGICRIFLVKI
jgi:hypothetical protein